MKRKLIATIIAAAMITASLTGCGSTSTAKANEMSGAGEAEVLGEKSSSGSEYIAGTEFEGVTAKEKYNFSIIVKSFESTYWQAAIQGMKMAAEDLGVTYDAQGPNTESDIADQVNMLNTSITSAPPAIGLAACDTASVLDSLETAKNSNIPIVCFDTGIDDAPEGSVVATIATDNIAAGATAAEHMYEVLKDKISSASSPVRIGEVNQDATALNIQQRGLGFIDKFIELAKADGKSVAVTGNEFYVNNCSEKGDESSADIVIEVAVPAQTTVELCATEASTILNKADTIGIFGSNQITAEGILSANDNIGKLSSDPSEGVIGVGFDAGSIIKAAVSDGTFYGAVTQSPLMMGYYTIYAMTKVANGDTVSDYPTAGYWYDAANMQDADIAPNLYD